MPTKFPLPLESCEQEVLKQIRKVIGDKPVSENKLQFAPRWVIDKAIEKEKKNYKASVEPVESTSYCERGIVASLLQCEV